MGLGTVVAQGELGERAALEEFRCELEIAKGRLGEELVRGEASGPTTRRSQNTHLCWREWSLFFLPSWWARGKEEFEVSSRMRKEEGKTVAKHPHACSEPRAPAHSSCFGRRRKK